MKRIVSLIVLSLFVASPLLAQPIVLDQATNIVGEKQLEVGVDNLSYGVDVTKITDTDIQLTRTSMVVPLLARYGFTKDIEGSLTIPYVSLNSKLDNAGASTTTSDAMLSDIQLAGKKCFMYRDWDVSAGLGLTLPTGSQSDKFPAEFKKGMNIIPAFAASKGFTCPMSGQPMTLNLNLSYAITGEYDGKDKVKYDPSDVITLGVGVERNLACSKCMKEVNVGAELLYKSLSDQKVAGAKLDGSSGSQIDLVLGGRYNIKKDLKTKLGFAFSLGDEKYRDYDWKVLLGVTYLTKI